jgi:hypothetical protein
VAVVVTLRIAPGWAIVARGPANGLLPLSASVAGPDLAAAGAPSYPVPTADGMLRGDVRVVLPVRVAAAARAGSRAARVRLRVQPCREGGDCEPPESCVLDAPLEIGGRGR